MRTFYYKLLATLISFLFFLINIYVFSPILTATTLIFPYSVHSFDIIGLYPRVWKTIKLIYYITSYISLFLITNSLLSFKKRILKKEFKSKKHNFKEPISGLNLFLGYNSLTNQKVYILEKSLYQNILVTGTIGSREN